MVCIQQKLQEVIAPNQEIVLHITPYKTSNCDSCTPVFLVVKQMKRNMLVSVSNHCKWILLLLKGAMQAVSQLQLI